MFRDIFTNRLFIGALAIFIFCVGGSLLYMQHVDHQGAEDQKETKARVEQSNERQNEQPTAEVPVEQPAEVEHVHEDGTFHAEPHEPIAAPSEVSEPEVSTEVSTAAMEYNTGGGNPLPYGNIDIRDFEASKAAMIENAEFIKANWDPKAFFDDTELGDKELGRQLRTAYARATNIADAAMSGIYTRQQAREMNVLYFDLGISDLIGDAADKIVQRLGVE